MRVIVLLLIISLLSCSDTPPKKEISPVINKKEIPKIDTTQLIKQEEELQITF